MAQAMLRSSAPLILILPLLAACGTSEGFPSLARRAGEQTVGTAPSSSPVAETAPAAPLALADQSRLARFAEQARAAHAGFTVARPRVERLVAAARGAAMGAEAWSVASVALAELESRRSETLLALADIDSLFARSKVEGTDSAGIAGIRERVQGWVADENRVLESLTARLGA